MPSSVRTIFVTFYNLYKIITQVVICTNDNLYTTYRANTQTSLQEQNCPYLLDCDTSLNWRAQQIKLHRAKIIFKYWHLLIVFLFVHILNCLFFRFFFMSGLLFFTFDRWIVTYTKIRTTKFPSHYIHVINNSSRRSRWRNFYSN